MQCQNCQQDNPAGSQFCQYCGAKFGQASSFDIFPPSNQSAQASPPPPAQPPVSSQPPPAQASSPPVQNQAPPAAPPSPPPRASSAPATQNGGLGKKGLSTWNIWGPFAGYGQRGRHVSWLLDDLGHRATDLHQAVTGRFQQRQVPGSSMEWEQLVAQGLLVESRPFFFIKRGITTAALYIAKFGQDLYISQVTYVKGPISNIRVLGLALVILYQLFFMSTVSGTLLGIMNSPGSLLGGGGSSNFGPIMCVVFPLGVLTTIGLLLFLWRSILTYYIEKDFLAELRAAPNEFQYDDTLALEKAVEETVRQSLDTIGIDMTLMPPAEDNSRLRLI